MDREIYRVIVDRMGRYSICPADYPASPEWTDVGKIGTRDECLVYISQALDSGDRPS